MLRSMTEHKVKPMFSMFNKKSTALESQLNEAQQQIETARQALAELQAKLDAQAKELAAAEAASTKAAQDGDALEKAIQQDKKILTNHIQENELLLSQLMQVQEELESYYIEKNSVEKLYNALQVKFDHEQKQATDQKLKFDTQTSELAAAHAASTKAKQDGDVATKAAKEEAQAKTKALAELQAKYDTQAKELAAAHAATAKAKQDRDVLEKAIQQDKKILTNHIQENELLLSQLMQVQEELESYYIEKNSVEKLYHALQARWRRLEERHPSYVNFESAELVSFNDLSDAPFINWRIKDYTHRGVAFDEFTFQTILQDGNIGICLTTDGKSVGSEKPPLFPSSIKPKSVQLEHFLNMNQIEFRQIMAAATIIDQLEMSGWRGVDLPEGFDLNFWREFLRALAKQIQALPATLRYDSVKLKRELVNTDYEHLWIEFGGLSLGSMRWNKFEIRLGAASVQSDGFSQFPKFEIPLIDGKIKPFESWYAESHDDSGAKLELRFALEKNQLDKAVLAKLSDADKKLLLHIIYAIPNALKHLERQKTAIHREWITWINFAVGAIKVLEFNNAVKTSAETSKAANIEEKVTKVVNIQNKPVTKLAALIKTKGLSRPEAKAAKALTNTTKASIKSAAKGRQKA
jgi:hypothetical protein